MRKALFLGAALAAFAVPAFATECNCTPVEPVSNGCPAGWDRVDDVRVTSCCTPIEAEFGSRAEFEEAVMMEGWGREEDGGYVGYYDGGWHQASFPMNAHGGEQTGRSLAAGSFLHQGAQVMIPSVSANFVYRVDDHGPGISGRHVNMWRGEGREACEDKPELTTYICVK